MSGPAETDVLIFVEDPGAANYMLDLPAALAAHHISCVIMAEGHAVDYLRSRGFVTMARTAGRKAAALLDEFRPRLVAVGTSENVNTVAHALVQEARRRGIPSVGCVDASGNAAYRFRGCTENPLANAPDYLMVPDAVAREAYAALGFPADHVTVCGHPQHGRMAETLARLEAEGRDAIRRRLRLPASPGLKIVVFAGEISGGLNPAQYRRSPDYTLRGDSRHDGRTEIVLDEFLDAIAPIRHGVYLVLRLHPKQTREEMEAYGPRFDAVQSGGDPLALVYAADLIVGMTTHLLKEAVLLGRPALSIVPREAEREWLDAAAGIRVPCVSTRETLRAAFLDENLWRPPFLEAVRPPRDALAVMVECLNNWLLIPGESVRGRTR